MDRLTYSEARGPHGRALSEYFAGDHDATIVVHSSLGEHDEIPVAVFFRSPAEFFEFEREALRLCRGRILDVGAGTGVHALYLQERGHDVCAIDVMPEAVEIMRRRGVRNARLTDVSKLHGESYDTILMMMNGIGILGTLEELARFLRRAPQLLRPGGQILLDSGPARIVGVPDGEAAEIVIDEEAGYPGEAWIELEYRGERGPPFRELYADSETLCEYASAAGWRCEVVYMGEQGSYLARLVREI